MFYVQFKLRCKSTGSNPKNLLGLCWFRCRKVIRLIRDDYRRRSEYLAYLMKSKQSLLSTVLFLERATVRAKHEGDTYSQYLIKECIRLWLEEPKQEKLINQFRDNFRSATVIDEKIEILDLFMDSLLDSFVGNKGKFLAIVVMEI